MVAELILLTMLVVGIVMVGVGVTRVRRYGGRALAEAGMIGLGVVYYGGGAIGRRVGEYFRKVAASAGESVRSFRGARMAYDELPVVEQTLRELSAEERTGAISKGVAEQRRQQLETYKQNLLNIYETGKEGLGIGKEELYPGGQKGEGIFGERRGDYYGVARSFFDFLRRRRRTPLE